MIELLIVVAIIAILAAIAVPNFLEAQVRAKVSRTKADMRNIAIAIEAYSIDWNQPYYGTNEVRNLSLYFGQTELIDLTCLTHYTTPVAYMTSVPRDVFAVQGLFRKDTSGVAMFREYPITFGYGTLTDGLKTNQDMARYIKSYGFIGCLWSRGPNLNQKLRNFAGMIYEKRLEERAWASGVRSFKRHCLRRPIVRTNKGILTAPGIWLDRS